MKPVELSKCKVYLRTPEGGSVVLISGELATDEESKRRNVYGLDPDGHLIWQVDYRTTMPEVSTFTNIYFDDGVLKGYNYNGGEYEIDYRTGACRPLRLLK